MTQSLQTRIEQTAAAIAGADYILLGGGAGLSDAAGIHFSGPRFETHFAPFIERYGFTDLYTSSFHPFPTPEEHWAYWAHHIHLNRYATGATQLYLDLFELVKQKQHFVISTNVESQFEKAGFAPERIFQVQGDYRYLQCARACHNTLYDNEPLVHEMVAQTVDCQIPTALVPTCPVCGGEMAVNLRANEYFVQDARWYQARGWYEEFLRQSTDARVVYLELGVGFNTPGIIRYPFEQMTYEQPDARLIRLNRDHPAGPPENTANTIAFSESMDEVLAAIANCVATR